MKLGEFVLMAVPLLATASAQSCEGALDTAEQFSALRLSVEKFLEGGPIKEGIVADMPPRPEGLRVSGALYNISLMWNWAGQIAGTNNGYKDHAYTNIYRSLQDNFSSARLIGKSEGTAYTDRVGYGAAFYYWITNVADRGGELVEGHPQSCEGFFAQTG